MIPSVGIRKVDGGTGTVRPGDVGVLGIVAPCEKAGATAEKFLSVAAALASKGGGPLVEAAAYVMPTSGHAALLVKGKASTPADYSAVTPGAGNVGSSVATMGITDPLDDYAVRIDFLNDGTIGTTGIKYTYSLDDGLNNSAPQALGVATSIAIPDSGVTLDFSVAAVKAGDFYTCTTTGAVDTNADLVDALEALRVSSSPFEAVLVHQPADATTVSTVDAWLTALDLTGRFKCAVLSARARTIGTETEAQYLTYLQGLFAASHSLSTIVCADVGDVVSTIPNRGTTGCTQARPSGWAIAARLMAIPMGQDAAFGGPVPQFGIQDEKGSTKYHDEFMSPGLDDLRLSTLCTMPGKIGTFIGNARILSPVGSDFVFAQHARVINRACEIGFAILAEKLSIGVRKTPVPGPLGERYIAEGDALQIEQVANDAIVAELKTDVDALRFTVSRTDDISSNAGADVHGSIEIVALAYIKKFTVTAGFVKSLSK